MPKEQSGKSQDRRTEPNEVTQLKTLRERVRTDGVFGKAEAEELLTLMIGDGADLKAEEEKVPEPPDADKTVPDGTEGQ